MCRKTGLRRGAARGDWRRGRTTCRTPGRCIQIRGGRRARAASSRPIAHCISTSSWDRARQTDAAQGFVPLMGVSQVVFGSVWPLTSCKCLRMPDSFSSWFCIISFCLLVSWISSLMPFFFLISYKTNTRRALSDENRALHQILYPTMQCAGFISSVTDELEAISAQMFYVFWSDCQKSYIHIDLFLYIL